MNTKRFSLGAVLTAMTGVLLTTLEEMYAIHGWLSGGPVMTHQLPRIGRECAPVLKAQFPELAQIDVSGVNRDNWREWLHAQELVYGTHRDVAPAPDGAIRQLNPFQDLAETLSRE